MDNVKATEDLSLLTSTGTNEFYLSIISESNREATYMVSYP